MPPQRLLGAALHEAGEIVRGPGTLALEWQHLVHILGLLKLRVLIDHPGLRQMLLQAQSGTPFG